MQINIKQTLLTTPLQNLIFIRRMGHSNRASGILYVNLEVEVQFLASPSHLWSTGKPKKALLS